MNVRCRIPKDRRSSSRVVELLNCHFTYRDSTHKAVMVNLSQKGALFSSRFQVPKGETIDIAIQTNQLQKKLTLRGIVERSNRVTTDHGIMGRFFVRFGHTPLDLLVLLARLNAKYM